MVLVALVFAAPGAVTFALIAAVPATTAAEETGVIVSVSALATRSRAISSARGAGGVSNDGPGC